MKVYLSNSEVCDMIREKFGLDQSVEIVIETAEAAKAANMVKWYAIVSKIDDYIAADQKIQAIKYIRETSTELGFYMGLKEAKDIADNWPNIRTKVQTNQSFLF